VNSIFAVQGIIMLALGLLALALQVYALVDAARQRADAFPATGNQTKQIWLLITGVATAIGFVSLQGPLNFFNLLAIVAAAVYLTKVRPQIHQISGRGGSSSGYSGGW
jgi:4-amino-4-deoxy-L-arabinose transferase-like glycosyltransferase